MGTPSFAEIINGNYHVHAENHGKLVFKRDELYQEHPVLVYFWRDEDEDDESGWWFAPKVGDDFAWAQIASDDALPPESGWHVPHDGEIDKKMRVVRKIAAEGSNSSKDKKKAAEK